ncbi:MAG: hypothetical protein JWO58_3023, partial [Chitinophagaceae bacterium]|nr:hypothetical protein [Chitinophagaceae bacterium]
LLCFAFFYLNIYFFIPTYLSRHRLVSYGLIITLFLVLNVMVNILLNYLFADEIKTLQKGMIEATNNNTYPSPHILPSLLIGIFVFAVSTSYKIISEWYIHERERKELENEKLVSELSFLKSQVNPHFLFNTLNNIYSLSMDHSEHTSESIMKLSQLLRYMIYETEEEYVSLEKELTYIQDYIDLQKIRLTENIALSFVVSGNIIGKQIEPMLLIPFIENAFKHGVDYSSNSWIRIRIDLSNPTQIELSVTNSNYAKISNDKTSGIGLQNVQKRIKLLYPDKHTLNINSSKETFSIRLVITMRS